MCREVFSHSPTPAKNSASLLVGRYEHEMQFGGGVSCVRATALLLGLSVTYAYHMLPPSPSGKMGVFLPPCK